MRFCFSNMHVFTDRVIMPVRRHSLGLSACAALHMPHAGCSSVAQCDRCLVRMQWRRQQCMTVLVCAGTRASTMESPFSLVPSGGKDTPHARSALSEAPELIAGRLHVPGSFPLGDAGHSTCACTSHLLCRCERACVEEQRNGGHVVAIRMLVRGFRSVACMHACTHACM